MMTKNNDTAENLNTETIPLDPYQADSSFPKRKRMRWNAWNYSLHASYFLTIVTHHRTELFGEIIQGTMRFNAAGRMIEKCYQEMADLYHDVAAFGDMVIMPNHLHCIITLLDDETISIPKLMQRFKSTTTTRYMQNAVKGNWPRIDHHLWQRSYYDHIIRSQHANDYIHNYIYHNPKYWMRDLLNPHCNPDNVEIVTDEIRKHENNKGIIQI